MNPVTVIIVANEEYEYAKLCLECIRKFNDTDDLSVVLVDNASTDGLREWAGNQTDFTYVYMDEGVTPFGSILSDVIENLDITGNILVMEPRYLLTPQTISRMSMILDQDDHIGMVGALINGESHHQKLPDQISKYEDAVFYSINDNNTQAIPVIGLSSGPFMVNRQIIDEIGSFDREIGSFFFINKSLTLKLLEHGYRCSVVSNAIFWNIEQNSFCSAFSRKYILQDEQTMERLYGMHYFNFQHNNNLVNEIDCNSDKDINVLEIGCDCGATLLEIKTHFPNAHVYGCELNESAVKVASCFVEAKRCNIEHDSIPFDVKFDYVIFGDVLEHLHDPQNTLRYVSETLKTGGKIIASIPNVMHISVIYDLLRGHFTYTEMGLLDKTHIHLFTYNEIIRMFEEIGFGIEDIYGVYVDLSDDYKDLIAKLMDIEPSTERFMYESYQYVLRARKS